MEEDSKNIIEEQDTELTQDEARELEEQKRAMEAIRKFTEADEDEDEDSLGEITLKKEGGGHKKIYGFPLQDKESRS